MISISLNFKPEYQRFFQNFPKSFEEMKIKASKRVLLLWHDRAFKKAPYDTGTLRGEIKPHYNRNVLVAGTHHSKKYALIHDVGGRAGIGGSVLIKPKHYFFKMAEESEDEVLRIYEEEAEKVING